MYSGPGSNTNSEKVAKVAVEESGIFPPEENGGLGVKVQ